jgi:hypothetical protein
MKIADATAFFEKARADVAGASLRVRVHDAGVLAWNMRAAPDSSAFGRAFVRMVRCDDPAMASRIRDALFCIAMRYMCEHRQAEHIVPHTEVCFFATTDGDEWFAMTQEVAACDLYQAMQARGADTAALLARTLRAVAYMHDALGIFHGDLHARNVLVMGDGAVRLCDFELASSHAFHIQHRHFYASSGADVPKFPLLRSTCSMSKHATRSEPEQFDPLHWSHGRWFLRSADFRRDRADFSREQFVTSFGPRFDIDVAMLVASIPDFAAGVEQSIFASHTRESACLSWALVGAQCALPSFISPHQLLPYLFCPPADYHVCSVGAHSVRDAIPKYIRFPFAVAARLAGALDGSAPLSRGAMDSARFLCHAHFAKAVAPACALDAAPEQDRLSDRILARLTRRKIFIQSVVRSSRAEAGDRRACACERHALDLYAAINRFIRESCGYDIKVSTFDQCATLLRNIFFFVPVFCRLKNEISANAESMRCRMFSLVHNCCNACAPSLQRLIVLMGAFRAP